MTSFRIGISPNRRAAARYVSHVLRTIQQAYAEEQQRNGITQSDIARKLDIHRSIISRELHGRRDISLGRVAEYAWALGRNIVFELPAPEAMHGDNRPVEHGAVNRKPAFYAAAKTATFPTTDIHLEIKTTSPTFIARSHA